MSAKTQPMRARARPIRRPRMRILPFVAFTLLVPGTLPAQRVEARGGNLFYHASAQAPPRQLTTSGRDRDQRLSPDGRTVAFIRGTPGNLVMTALDREEATELWIIRTDGSGARMLVRGRTADDPRRTLASMQSPQFSPDGRRIYFLSTAWVTSAAVHAVDTSTGREWFVAPGNSLEVVPSGRYAGHLLVGQHRYFLAGGSYDWLWLLTPDGSDVGPVGETEGALEAFREMYVSP
jgi:hypothetical protein